MTLSIEGMRQGYHDNIVIDDISFDIEKGEMVSILGPNGSGKSTLIKTICRIMMPLSGNVSVDGVSIQGMEPKEFSHLIGYVPQKYMPTDYVTVFDSILIGRAPYMFWSYSDADFLHAEMAMDRMGIFDLAEKHVNNISGGQIQKVVLARAIAQDPEYFILDEPTSALDLKNQMLALRTIKDVISQGKAGALVALHDLNLAMHFCDRVILLKDGHIHSSGRPVDVITEDSIRDVYGVSSEILEGRDGLFVHILEDE